MILQARQSGWTAIGTVVALLLGCNSPTEPAPPEAPTEVRVQLVTGVSTIHGTLLLPPGGPAPVVLLIAGSGPTDRNGNSAAIPGANNSLKLLAEGLAEAGIASLRYDKRGIGESAPAAPTESAIVFDSLVADAAGWLRALRGDPRFTSVTVAGHSEGSLIGMLAAHEAAADAFVSIAGVARRASEVLRDQLRPLLSPALWEESERILGELEAGRTTSSVPPELMVLYRPSVQPYLISWFRYVPTEEITRFGGPVLIAHGTTDMQVPAAEAEALHRARPDAGLLLVAGMNHILKLVPADPARQQASYSDPSLPVAPELIQRIAAFAKSAPHRR